MRKILVIALVLVLAFTGSSSAKIIVGGTTEQRVIPSDPNLPAYDNPTEIDTNDGKLHLSLKGVFRQVDEKQQPTEWIAFVFVATPQEDMVLGLDIADIYDGAGTRFSYRGTPWIGRDRTWNREIIAGIPMRVCVWFNMPPSEAGTLPSIARANINFNGQIFQFRNIKTEDASVWEEIAENLKLSKSLHNR